MRSGPIAREIKAQLPECNFSAHKNSKQIQIMTMPLVLLATAAFAITRRTYRVRANSTCGCDVPFDQLPWHTLDAARIEAQSSTKPILLFIHKGWCPVCQSLKHDMESSAEFEKLIPDFVLADGGDGKEPLDASFKPDGTYYPRVFFLQPNGQVTNVQVNSGGSRYKFFPQSMAALVDAMKNAISGSS